MDLREVTEFLRDALWYIVAILVLIIVFTFIVAFQGVAGNSMSPTLEDGQIVLVSKFSYYFGFPSRNEIVVLKKNNMTYVKRVIGLPNEKIEYLDGILYINGKAFKEEFLNENVVTSNFLFVDICSKEDCPDGVIPKDKYLVLGDNRGASEDSRSATFGLVDKKDLKGKVVFRVFPVKDFGRVN